MAAITVLTAEAGIAGVGTAEAGTAGAGTAGVDTTVLGVMGAAAAGGNGAGIQYHLLDLVDQNSVR